MADAKPIDSAGAFGIPKWMMRKGTRYEVDDFIVSPPSNEDGGFFHLRYGRAPSPRPSTYDRINQELGMTVEVKDGDPVLSSGGSTDGLTSPTLAISPQGLSVRDPSQGSLSSEDSQGLVKPLLVLPFKFGADSAAETSNSSETATPSPASEELFSASSDLPEQTEEAITKANIEEVNVSSKLSNDQNSEALSEKQGGIIKKISRDISLKLSLAEKIQDISGPSHPNSSTVSTPFVTPLTTPQSSPRIKRKISGVVVEQNNMSATQNYFFTKPFSGEQQTGSSFSPETNTGSLSATAAQGAQKLEEGANQSMNIDISQMVIGKKRQRPKASKLREMNFWAPTSM